MSVRDALAGMGLPRGDLHDLPDSAKRFPDGAQYRVEIPSTEGPRCLEVVLEEAERLEVRVHRISQGSGVFLLTDDELDEMARLGATAPVEVSLFARPNAGWDTSATSRAPAGAQLGGVRLVARAGKQVKTEPRPAHPLTRERDRRRFQVRSGGIDVGGVAEAELDVDRRRDPDQLGDLVQADKAAKVVGDLDVNVER